MIPYIEIPTMQLWGSITVQPFGVLVAMGCIAGAITARWHAISCGLDTRRFSSLLAWTLIAGFLFSHIVVLLFYYPERLSFSVDLLNIGKGMSSFGGFFGGALGAVIFLRYHRLPVLAYGDALLLGLTVGWFFGRLGCSIAHDHPGLPSDFILAVDYPTGSRHDLGFYEWLFTIGLNVLIFAIRPNELRPGVLTGLICVLYAPVRFMLDFLRVGDKLYYGLTPGQYFAVVLLIAGVSVLVLAIKQPHKEPGRFP